MGGRFKGPDHDEWMFALLLEKRIEVGQLMPADLDQLVKQRDAYLALMRGEKTWQPEDCLDKGAVGPPQQA